MRPLIIFLIHRMSESNILFTSCVLEIWIVWIPLVLS